MPAVTLSFSLWFGFITAVVHGGFALDALPNAFSTLGLEGVDQVGSNQGPFSGWTRIPQDHLTVQGSGACSEFPRTNSQPS